MATRSWPHGATAFVLAFGLAPLAAAQDALKLNQPDSAGSGTATTHPLKIRIVNDEPKIKPIEEPLVERPPVAGEIPKAAPAPKAADGLDETVIRINTASPTPGDLFRFETEQQFRARLVKETERWRDRVHIPDLAVAPSQPLPAQRGWPSLLEEVEPGRLCYYRLGFAQPMSERYGQSCGPLQPFLSVGLFYGEVATWPVRLALPPWSIMQCDDLSDLNCYPQRNR